MIYKSQGIILKQIKYGESSLILDVFTEEKGLRSCIVSGVRAKKSKAAMYQIMNCLDLVAYDKDSDKLNRIKESSLRLIYREIPMNIFKSSIGVFLMDVCKNAIKEKEPNLPLFDFIKSWMQYLDTTKQSLANIPCLFMLQLSEHLGFKPHNNYSTECNQFNLVEGAYQNTTLRNQYILTLKQSENLFKLQNVNITSDDLTSVQISKTDRAELLNQLINFYRYHIDGFKELKSLEVLAGVLN